MSAIAPSNICRVVPARMAGLSLVELMVAMTISLVLIFGATQVYVDSRNAYNTNEAVARLQENARYAMAVIEPDIRMSNYWGLVKGASLVGNQTAAASGATNPEVLVCGATYAIDLNNTIQGDNNSYSRTGSCNTVSGWTTSAQVSSDTLTVRHASTIVSPTTNGVLQICSTRTAAQLYSNGAACGAAPAGQVNNLVANIYYVDNNSNTSTDAIPSLRRKALTSIGGVKQFQDQLIMSGVEDMQVQFGIDSGVAPTGIATQYINATQAIPAGAQVVAVRVWLLIRSDAPEPGFIDNRTYSYGDRVAANGAAVSTLNAAGSAGRIFQPSLAASNALTSIKRYRRLLICRTFQVRNAVGT